MLRPRIIPCLLIHAGGLVKTITFGNPTYVGDPINAVRIFNEKETDELVVLDIDASVTGAEPDYKMIAHLAAECRMPLCYGGGVRTAQQARRIVQLGVEKVSISAAAIHRLRLIEEMAQEIGSQSVVLTLDVKESADSSQHEVWTHNGRRNTHCSALDLARHAESLGAGEIILNSIDRDGTMKGYDLAFASLCRKTLRLPLTFLGGAGSLNDIGALFRQCGVVGAGAGSLFVFKGPYRAVLINYPSHAQKDDVIHPALHGHRQSP